MSLELYKALGISPRASQEEIRRAYFTLVRRHPPEKDPERFKQISSAYATLNNARARRDYDDLEQHGAEVTQLFLEAENLASNCSWTEAAARLKQVVVLMPGADAAWNMLGICYIYDNKWDKAAQVLARLTSQSPGVSVYWLNLGYAYQGGAGTTTKGDGEKSRLLWHARQAFARCIELESIDSRPYRAMAETYVQEQRFDRALSWLEKAVSADGEVDVHDVDAFIDMCMIHALKGDSSSVEATSKRLLAAIPQNPELRQYVAARFAERGDSLGRDGLPGLASLFFRVSLSFDPDSSEIRTMYEATANVIVLDDEWERLTGDRLVVPCIKDLIALALAKSSGDEVKNEETIRSAAWEALRDYSPKEVASSVNRVKSEYPAIFGLVGEVYGAIRQSPLAENPAMPASAGQPTDRPAGGLGGAVVGGVAGAAIGGPLGAIIGAIIGWNLSNLGRKSS